MVPRQSEAVRNALLSAGAGLGLFLYILGCGPSWRPDGEAIVFPYRLSGSDHEGVAIFDRATGKATPFYRTEKTGLATQWSRDGQSVLVSIVEGFRSDFIIVPARPGGLPIHVDSLEGAELSLLPIPEVDGRAYFGGGAITRVDLSTGSLESRALGEEEPPVNLYRASDSILYTRELGVTEDLEVGTLDPETLTLHPRFVVEHAFLEGLHLDELWFLAFEPRTSRVAIAAVGPGDDVILVFDRDRVETVLRPEIPSPSYELGDIVWSADGRWLYAAVLTPWADTRSQLSIAEIPFGNTDGGSRRTRVTPITWLRSELDPYDDESSVAVFQIALSPDGRSLAVSTASLDEDDVDAENRALYVVDLTDPDRSVEKIPPPKE